MPCIRFTTPNVRFNLLPKILYIHHAESRLALQVFYPPGRWRNRPRKEINHRFTKLYGELKNTLTLLACIIRVTSQSAMNRRRLFFFIASFTLRKLQPLFTGAVSTLTLIPISTLNPSTFRKLLPMCTAAVYTLILIPLSI